MAKEQKSDLLAALNEQQRRAAEHGAEPLLLIAGAGTGKTNTLVHRVAAILEQGADPQRLLLLTFTRRAAAEMLQRANGLLEGRRRHSGGVPRIWGGTFHAIAARLLRQYGEEIGLSPDFTILDRGDAEDLLAVVRTELGLEKIGKRFPNKGSCLAIYSACVNTQRKLNQALLDQFPQYARYEKELAQLFQAFVERKESGGLLDYDDLLLFWHGLLEDPAAAAPVRDRFDWVLVDEYQDTNRLQAEILERLRPNGRGLTAVGDDAQSIYSFRGAAVENILQFPERFPGTVIIKLEQNYRSTQPILTAANLVIAGAARRYRKNLWTEREAGELPELVNCDDEHAQAEFVAIEVLALRETGTPLREQAVLFRASHHSIALEAELTRRHIPFVKYGGLKFMEAAHVKDTLAFLRLAENPRDVVSGSRLLMLLPGVGPRKAAQWMERLRGAGGNFAIWGKEKPPTSDEKTWRRLIKLLAKLAGPKAGPPPAQVQGVLKIYEPLLREKYDNAESRLRDLEQFEMIASRFVDRGSLLTELALDPPNSSQDLTGPPHLDDDFLILSTIHSAKGLEWRNVFVLHATDGNIPSDMATRDAAQIEEERRLFYVALTRARDRLYVCHPRRYYQSFSRHFDQYGSTQITRFLDSQTRKAFASRVVGGESAHEKNPRHPEQLALTRARLRSAWR